MELKMPLVSLAWILVFLMLISVFGCNPGGNNDQDPGEDEPGDVTDPEDEVPVDVDPGDTEVPFTDLDSPIALVPIDAVSTIESAVIRQGDLWLRASNGQMWRQTNTGDVVEILWAPDGHALAYISAQNLYYLAPGSNPVEIADHIVANKAWINKNGFVWSPDSSGLAYGIDDGNQMRITGVPGLSETSLLLDQPLSQGPYWLSDDNLVYGTSIDERPSLIILNTMGDVLSTMPDTGLPFPVLGGLVAATGIYDPEGMESFYYTGLIFSEIGGSNVNLFYDQSPRFCSINRDPVLPTGLTSPKYLAISDCQTLFLQKYAGLPNKAQPTQVELLSQDVFLTFSEFGYPFWFAWAPGGSNLAALRFTFTQEGDYGQQEGSWDLVVVDRSGNWQTLNTLYYVSGDERPVPFQSILPLNWSSCGNFINYLVERDDSGYDLWRVAVASGSEELVLENCSLPEYRPLP